PLLLLNGHVCALSPPPQQETKDRADQKSKANGGDGYMLREPYAWESDEEATGFLLPRWMWEVVDGETSGGGLLMITAPGTANNSAPIFSPASLGRQRQGNSTKPFAVDDGTDNAVLGEEGFQPFLQLAYWGHGSFHPLARFSSGGLLLGGGSEGGDGAGEGSWSESPPGGTATRLKARMEHNPTDNDRMHAIRTRHGGLEVASAADLHLRSGPAQPGECEVGKERGVRIEAIGENGTIHLNSDSLGWTLSPPSPSAAAATAQATAPASHAPGVADSSGPFNVSHPHRFVPSFRVDRDRLEAGGFSDAVRLSAARSFDLAVIGAGDGVGNNRENIAEGEEERSRMAQEREQLPSFSGSRPGGALLRGDFESMNASAGLLSIEAIDSVQVTAGKGARVRSAAGDVVLSANSVNGSLVQEGGRAILGAAPTVSFTAAATTTTTTGRGMAVEDEQDGRRFPSGGGGGYLNLTAEAATVGVLPGKEGRRQGWGTSIEADHEVRLRASNSSLLSVSTAAISLHTATIVLLSSSLLMAEKGIEFNEHGDDLNPPPPPPPPSPPSSSLPPSPATITGNAPESEASSGLNLDGGVLAMSASASVQVKTYGAFLQLIGRRTSSSSRYDEGGSRLELGAFVADADAVRIRARSASAGVSIVADGVNSAAESSAETGTGSGTGGRVEVLAEGVSIEGLSTSLGASRRVTLRVGGSPKRRTDLDKGEVLQAAAEEEEEEEERGSSSVEMGEWGVRVVAGLSPEPLSDSSNDSGSSSSSSSSNNNNSTIFLHAASRVVLVAPQLAISHGGGAGDGDAATTSAGNGRPQENIGSGTGDAGGGGGLWSNGTALTGRADHRVFLQAGGSTSGSDGADGATSASSHVSIRESCIHVYAGGGAAEASLPTLPFPAPAPTANSASEEDKACNSAGDGSNLPKKGLLVEVDGTANFSSQEGMQLQTAGEMRVASSARTLMHSSQGMLLSGSPPGGGGVGDGDGTATAVEKALWGAIPRPRLSGGKKLQEEEEEDGGHILLAPGVGSGVGIGPGFSSRDLAETSSAIRSSRTAFFPRQAPWSPWSPRGEIRPCQYYRLVAGSTSALRFGCERLPYSGGLEVRHHRDGDAGDTLVLELASSPGRIVGDTRGRWGVGAVPIVEQEKGLTAPQLAAVLHVFGGTAATATAAGPPGLRRAPAAPALAPVTVLVESAAGSAGVLQLLNSGGSRGASSVPHASSVDNTIVLSSKHSGGHDAHSHWVVSQLSAGGDKGTLGGKANAHPPPGPRWTDSHAEPSSWAGGMTLTHIVSDGGPSTWTSPPTASSPWVPPAVAETGGDNDHHGTATAARPAIALGANGRSGFGTGSTGARVTIGGALMAEQVVLVLSDEGMVRDIEHLGVQGGSQAMETIRGVGVVGFGWTKEASASYGLEADVRQMGIIAQQAEEKQTTASPPSSLVWRDAATGRKAVSHTRLLVTLVAAFQNLDRSTTADANTRDERLGELEKLSASAAERSGRLSERLGAVEAMAGTGLESLLVQAGAVSALEGRLSEQGAQAEAVQVALASVQDSAAQERGATQEWRMERSRREQELEKEVLKLKNRLAATEDQRIISQEEQEVHQKAQDEQIRALSLRVGAIHTSHSSKCDSSLLTEVEELRKAQGLLEARLAKLAQRADQSPALNEEA
ncbi:unnamed protein product, partial [Pylaiella littoralis]